MKTVFRLFLIIMLVSGAPVIANAQAEELEQLALDTEKLAQMKSILSEMYKGYQILTNGYNAIKSLAEGNFNLHSTYLTGLLQVSPAVKNYVRVADIIAAQSTLVTEYKSALSAFKKSGAFNFSELSYISSVYENLFTKSLDNLDELVMVLTDDQLRANDAERLAAIDRIYNDVQDKLSFIRSFNGKTGMLASQRQRQLQENNTLSRLIGH